MKLRDLALAAALHLGFALCAFAAVAADYPTPKEGDFVAKDFRFSTGDVLPELKLHYTTIGEPTGEPILILHGTAGSGTGLLTPAFAGEIFGAGQALDAKKYFVIIPDALGAGKSSKPSDGLKGKFPKYNYDDMVQAHYRLVTEGLGIKHVRLVLGNSMGGMHTWVWGVKYPDFMDALVPMASQPTEMSARNWMMRRMLIDAVRKDPDFNDGNYVSQPKGLRAASVFYGIATNGGSIAYQAMAPNRAAADKVVDDRLAAPFTADANDFVYQWDASRDYNPQPMLTAIKAPVLVINSADDERNPPEFGLVERELKRLQNARLFLIPTSPDTRGHGTTGMAKSWAKEVAAFMQQVPKRGM